MKVKKPYGVYLPPLNNQTVNLQCLVLLTVDSFEAVIARSNWSLWRFSHIALPRSGAVRTGDGYTVSAYGQSRDNNDIISFNSR